MQLQHAILLHMSKSLKVLIPAVLVVVIAVIAAYTYNPKTASLKIGVITPLTGEAGAWGNWVKNSIELASENSNLKMIYEDSMCDPKTGVNAYKKLTDVDKVDLITGFVCSSVAMAVSPLAEQDGITMITTGASTTDLKDAGEHIFNMWPLNDAQAIFVADYLISQGIRKAAILYVNNDFGLTMKQSFEQEFKEKGGQIVSVETVEQKATDLRTQLTKIKQAEPEYVFLATYYENAGFALKQSKELNYNLKFIGSIDTYNQQTKEIAGDAIEGYQYSNPKNSDKTAYQAFVKDYEERFGEKPDLPGEAAYDTINLIKKALEENSDIETYFLRVKDYLGASGKLEIDEKGNVVKEFEIVKAQ